jgi:hypothetical protein|tara:strand:+ start:787 stop:972 length:186 start_codon:yes stop_codon:yes gene_type:complete
METIEIVGMTMGFGFFIINNLFSKRDGRFTNGFRPFSLSITGWIVQILWLGGMGYIISLLG